MAVTLFEWPQALTLLGPFFVNQTTEERV